jgi:hypothetical protein
MEVLRERDLDDIANRLSQIEYPVEGIKDVNDAKKIMASLKGVVNDWALDPAFFTNSTPDQFHREFVLKEFPNVARSENPEDLIEYGEHMMFEFVARLTSGEYASSTGLLKKLSDGSRENDLFTESFLVPAIQFVLQKDRDALKLIELLGDKPRVEGASNLFLTGVQLVGYTYYFGYLLPHVLTRGIRDKDFLKEQAVFFLVFVGVLMYSVWSNATRAEQAQHALDEFVNDVADQVIDSHTGGYLEAISTTLAEGISSIWDIRDTVDETFNIDREIIVEGLTSTGWGTLRGFNDFISTGRRDTNYVSWSQETQAPDTPYRLPTNFTVGDTLYIVPPLTSRMVDESGDVLTIFQQWDMEFFRSFLSFGAPAIAAGNHYLLLVNEWAGRAYRDQIGNTPMRAFLRRLAGYAAGIVGSALIGPYILRRIHLQPAMLPSFVISHLISYNQIRFASDLIVSRGQQIGRRGLVTGAASLIFDYVPIGGLMSSLGVLNQFGSTGASIIESLGSGVDWVRESWNRIDEENAALALATTVAQRNALEVAYTQRADAIIPSVIRNTLGFLSKRRLVWDVNLLRREVSMGYRKVMAEIMRDQGRTDQARFYWLVGDKPSISPEIDPRNEQVRFMYGVEAERLRALEYQTPERLGEQQSQTGDRSLRQRRRQQLLLTGPEQQTQIVQMQPRRRRLVKRT